MNETEKQNTVSGVSPSKFKFNPRQPLQYSVGMGQDSALAGNDNNSIFVCNLCMKTFYNKTALQNHKNATHDVGDLSNTEIITNRSNCVRFDQDVNGICGFKFIPLDPEENQSNSNNDTIIKTFSVDTCYLVVKVEDEISEPLDSRMSRMDPVKKNQQNTTKPSVDLSGPFTCTLPSTICPELQCRKIFFSCCEYSSHYREVHTKRRKMALRCQVCEKVLDKGSDTNDRLVAQFPSVCRICGLNFVDNVKLNEHMRLMHTKVKQHQCSICFKCFAQPGGLQQHLRMHTGVRPFMCTFCPKAFTQKAGLDQHLRIHTKVKPFKCVVCGKCFSQSVHLRQHMRTHTNIQPFECSVCGKRFKQRSHLNFHLRSHMNEAAVAALDNEMDFFKLANLQPVQDGETLYYAAELTSEPSPATARSMPFIGDS